MTPSDFLNFAESNIVKTGLLKNSSVYGRPETVGVQPDTFFKGSDGDGLDVSVFNLKQNANSKDLFKAYVCDYVRGELHYQVLGNEADFCFTITMNGCTFTVGNPTANGEVLVSHGNQAGVEDGPGVPLGSMVEKQTQLATAFHGADAMQLSPNTYRPTGNENISTFAVRMNGDWNFFYQSYKSAGGGKLELLGLFPFKTKMLMN